METERYLRINQVMEIVGIEKSTVWKWMKTKGFPKQIKLSPKVSVWKLSEVEAWIDKQTVEVA